MPTILEFFKGPWPWYVAGPLIGLVVPLLLLIDNKLFGISSNLRHICAACLPSDIAYLKYDWKKESWNLFFVAGILIGAFLAAPDPYQTVPISSKTTHDLQALGLSSDHGLVPYEIFSWKSLLTLRGVLFLIFGGFLVGFGTRYAGGCTSGHGLTGTATLQWPSFIALIFFFVGGILSTHFLLPLLLKL